MSNRRNCPTQTHGGYPSAPSQLYKDPNIERNAVAPMDMDAYTQKASMRDRQGASLPERKIYQNPEREIREYPIPLFIDSFRTTDEDSFENGRIQLSFTDGGSDGITVRGQVRNVKKMEISQVRVPIVAAADVPELALYNRFSLQVAPIGSYYSNYVNSSTVNYHYFMTYEVDSQDAGRYILTAEEPCHHLKPEPVITELEFVLRTPFAIYPLPRDKIVVTIPAGAPLPNPVVFTLVNFTDTNLVNGDDIIFICPDTSSPTLNQLLTGIGRYTVANANTANRTFETSPAIDGSSITLTQAVNVQVLIPKNRILFTLTLTGMKA